MVVIMDAVMGAAMVDTMVALQDTGMVD